jgi:hypothetical protein
MAMSASDRSTAGKRTRSLTLPFGRRGARRTAKPLPGSSRALRPRRADGSEHEDHREATWQTRGSIWICGWKATASSSHNDQHGRHRAELGGRDVQEDAHDRPDELTDEELNTALKASRWIETGPWRRPERTKMIGRSLSKRLQKLETGTRQFP